jgi:hypothetical protein
MRATSVDTLLAESLEGALVYRCLSLVAELGVADVLAEGPLSLEALARRCQADATSLGRVLRLLAMRGVFQECADGSFTLSDAAQALRAAVPGSVRDRLRAGWQDLAWTAYGQLPAAVRTGTPAFDLAYGMPVFEYFAAHPDRGRAFDRAMARVSAPEDDAIAGCFDFGACRHVVDVGGGRGGLLRAVLARQPSLEATLFDRGAVIDGIELPGIARQSGDFFSAVPSGADLYLLKRILHDWNDTDAVRILRNVRQVLDVGGQGVLVIEALVSDGNERDPVKVQDISMLALTPGRERRLAEFVQLFAAAGLRLSRPPVPVPGFSVRLLQAMPA